VADTSSGLPDSYAPQQQVGSVGDWSVWPSNNSSSGHLNWGGTGNGLQVYSHTAAAAQPAGQLGMQLYMPTDIGREYTVWFITDNNNAGSLDAYALGYNDTTGRLTTLGSATVSRSGNYSITFTAVNDSSFLVLAASALDSDESFTINFASMLRMTNILVNTPTAPLAFRNKYRYGYNTQEKVDEISGPGNHYTALFWEYDTRLVRRWNLDPKPSPSISEYAVLTNSPIWFSDRLGDTIKVNNVGTILSNDHKDKLVYMLNQGKLTQIGEIGKKIDANVFYKNLLKNNIKEAKGIYNPLTFKNFVTDKGKWDYKNDKKSIIGFANDGKTQFTFEGRDMESQDIGNHHYGAVGKATGFTEEILLKQAGANQMGKPGASKPEWQKYKVTETFESDGMGPAVKIVTHEILPPYGDDPRDQNWIKSGFQYFYNINKK
jgi:hypothetical protein